MAGNGKREDSAFGNRFAVWRAGLARPATGFVSQPEPRSIGLYARGKQLIAGNFVFAGHLVEAPGTRIWDIAMPDAGFATEAEGFGWLDDLAAVGDATARARAQDWTWDWIARNAQGRGRGWTPDLTGRRLIRWINHAFLLLSGRDAVQAAAYYRALTTQTVFLSRRWKRAAPGLPRFEALTGLIVSGLALTGMDRLVGPALAALAEDCRREIDAEGGIPTRNPEELLEVFTLLIWVETALTEAGQPIPPPLTAAKERVAPTLRALRHADGGLARFHGGGRGMEGRLEMALANARVKSIPGHGLLAMGFARLSSGRTTVIIDAASPPGGRASGSAHASTLAFELTSGRRPVIVSCGSGGPFGADWRRAGRATPSHSTLAIDGYSSSRFDQGGKELLVDRAAVLSVQQSADLAGAHVSAAHNGWSLTHGLTHGRVLTLDSNGRRLTGTELLDSRTPTEQRRFVLLRGTGGPEGIGIAVRFHLHPDVDAKLDMGGSAVSLALKSGEIWVFRHDGRMKLGLEPSVFLEKGRLRPRGSLQIVLSGHATGFETRIGWTLAKAQDTPLAIRDLDRDDLPAQA